MELRLSGVVRESIVDGPGLRYTIFTQGCPHHCEGCHNPQTHDFNGGFLCSVDKLVNDIEKNPMLSGVTFSGGEPFCQAQALCEVARRVKEMGLSVVLFSGYTFEQLIEGSVKNPYWLELMKLSDTLIDGKFEQSNKDFTLAYRGSRNQRIINLKNSLSNHDIVEVAL